LAQIAQARRVLLTGASGFVGRALVPLLLEAGWTVRATSRSPAAFAPHERLEFIAADLASGEAIEHLVQETDAVVHLAARVHVMHDAARDPLGEFRRANVAVTELLARAAHSVGASQFVFASTIKVNGEGQGERPYRESDPPAPQDPYAVSKLEAELSLESSGVPCTILRPPLMYGPGVKGNFARLMKSVRNRRSLLFVDNFCSAILAALEQPAPGVRLYLVSDGEDVSVSELVRRMGMALGRPARLLPCPVAILQALGALAGMQAEIHRLTDSLLVDSSRLRELGWHPRASLDEGLRRTAQSF